jgi:uncharacterized protein YndB with AHSA1/START domain
MISAPLVIKRFMKASCRQIFEAWSHSDNLQQWFFPGKYGKVGVSNDFTVGGRYKLEIIGNDGVLYTYTGEYKEIVPNKKIVFTWNSLLVPETLVTVDLREVNHKTEITLTHELFPNQKSHQKKEEGWQGLLENLAKFLLQKSYQCKISYQASIEKAYLAITSEQGLKSWWSFDCSVNLNATGIEYTFRFDGTYCVMQVKELVLNNKVVWECLEQFHDHTNLCKKNEWVGTRILFNLNKNELGGTDLYFIHEGLTQELECFNLCQKEWNYFLKESLKTYLETGVGKPYKDPYHFLKLRL